MTHSLKIDSIKELCIINKKVYYTFDIKFEVKFTETSEISQSTEQYFANITPPFTFYSTVIPCSVLSQP